MERLAICMSFPKKYLFWHELNGKLGCLQVGNKPGKLFQCVHSYTSRVEESEAPGVLVRMAQELDYSPAMLAKLVLEHHLKKTCPDVNSESWPTRDSWSCRIINGYCQFVHIFKFYLYLQ